MHVQETEDGMVPALKEVQPRGKPMTILAWTRAFARFMSDYAMAHPDQLQDMLIHFEMVLQLARHRADWQAYNKQFRQQKPNGGYSFGHNRVELYTKAMARQGMGNPSNFRGSSQITQSRVPSGYCMAFHQPGQRCTNSPCRYLHQCFKCNSPTPHAAFLCRGNKKPNPVLQQQHQKASSK